MSYTDSVRAAAAALKRGDDANWELAELTWKNTSFRGQTPGTVSIRQWSEDVQAASGRSFGEMTARYYRDIWELYQGRVRDSWSEAYAQIRGGPVAERMVETDFNRAIANASPEQKQKAFATLAREPEVIADLSTSAEVFTQIVRDNPAAVQEAWKDTETNVALSTARWQARDELHEPMREAVRETHEVFEPKDSTLDRRIFLADVATKVEQWTRELNGIREFLEFSDDVDRVRRWATRQALDRLVDAAAACRDALPSSYEDVAPVATPVGKRDRRKLA